MNSIQMSAAPLCHAIQASWTESDINSHSTVTHGTHPDVSSKRALCFAVADISAALLLPALVTFDYA